MMTIVPVDCQRIAKFDVVEQAEKLIAQRKVIAVTEKVNAPTAVQILPDCDFPVASLDVNIATTPIQTFDGFGRKVVLFVNAACLNRIAVKPRLNFGQVVGVDKEKFFLHVEIIDAALLQLIDLFQKFIAFVGVPHMHHPFL